MMATDDEPLDAEFKPLAIRETSAQVATWVPSFVLPIEEMLKASDDMTEFQRRVMIEGVHYGKVPGTDKNTLFKPGAELLLSRMALRASDPIILDETIDYGDCTPDGTVTREGLIRFSVRRDIYRQTGPSETDRMLVSSGLGACTSREKKYRWRNTERVCPTCGKAAIIKGKKEYGGGWLCWKKKDGCGDKFSAGDPAIESQGAGQAFNPEVADLENTILKMASKRALVDATLLATGCSNAFTQDVGDDSEGDDTDLPKTAGKAPEPPSEPGLSNAELEALWRRKGEPEGLGRTFIAKAGSRAAAIAMLEAMPDAAMPERSERDVLASMRQDAMVAAQHPLTKPAERKKMLDIADDLTERLADDTDPLEKERRRMFALAKDRNVSDDVRRAIMLRLFGAKCIRNGKPSSTALNHAQLVQANFELENS